jgi:hypothetical protein
MYRRSLGCELDRPRSLLLALCSRSTCGTRRSRSLHVADNERRSISAVDSICQMRCQDNSGSRADQVAGMANHLGVGCRDFAHRLAVVWVTEDDSAVDESRVLRGKHVRGIVYELATLSGKKSVSYKQMIRYDAKKHTSSQP